MFEYISKEINKQRKKKYCKQIKQVAPILFLGGCNKKQSKKVKKENINETGKISPFSNGVVSKTCMKSLIGTYIA